MNYNKIKINKPTQIIKTILQIQQKFKNTKSKLLYFFICLM